MKTIVWDTEDQTVYRPPPIIRAHSGMIGFFDYPAMWDFEVGDEIRYSTPLGEGSFKVISVAPAEMANYPPSMRKVTAQEVGKHHRDYFRPKYMGYQCEGCGGSWAVVKTAEGYVPTMSPCFATELCSGLTVSLIDPEGPPPTDIPILIEWYRPEGDYRPLSPAVREHLKKNGLLRRGTEIAPEWVKKLASSMIMTGGMR